jgi:hypothetical protein
VAAGDRGGARRTDAEGARGRGAGRSAAPSRGGRNWLGPPSPPANLHHLQRFNIKITAGTLDGGASLSRSNAAF